MLILLSVDLVRDLIKATGCKYYTTPMGRTAIDEDPENGFGGVYVGGVSDPKVKEAVEKTDLAIMIGSLKSDVCLSSTFALPTLADASLLQFNTGEFSYEFQEEQTIELFVTRAPAPLLTATELTSCLISQPLGSHAGPVRPLRRRFFPHPSSRPRQVAHSQGKPQGSAQRTRPD